MSVPRLTITYIRREASDTWHFCKNCSNYPKKIGKGTVYEERAYGHPSYGEMCNQCRSKSDNNKCRGIFNNVATKIRPTGPA